MVFKKCWVKGWLFLNSCVASLQEFAQEMIMTDKTKQQQDKEIDRNSADSFPASDPVSPFVPAVPVEEDETQTDQKHLDKHQSDQ